MTCLLPKAFDENMTLATSFQDSRRCSKIPDDAASHGFALLSDYKRTCSAFPLDDDLPCVRVLACSSPPASASKCLACSSAMSRHETAMQAPSPAGNEPLKLVRLHCQTEDYFICASAFLSPLFSPSGRYICLSTSLCMYVSSTIPLLALRACHGVECPATGGTEIAISFTICG